VQPIHDLNDLASEVTRREGGKQSLGIAQVKEVVRIHCDIFAELRPLKFLWLVWKMRRNGKKRVDDGNQLKINFK